MSNGRARVVFTGAAGSLAGLGAAVEAGGAQFTVWPLLSFAPSTDTKALEGALGRIGDYAAICLTSPRAAEAVVRFVEQHDIDLAEAPVVWASPACEPVLRSLFPRIEVPPRDRSGDSLGVALAEMMLRHGVQSPVLFPCGDLHRDELVTRLRDAGRVVELVEAYRTVLSGQGPAGAVMSAADVVVVTSPSVARLLASVEHRERPALVAIGPTTADEASRRGWTPDAVAATPGVHAVARAIHSLLPSYS